MPFNSDTYYANKGAKDAWALLARARECRATGRLEDAAMYAQWARQNMRSSLFFRRLSDERKARRASGLSAYQRRKIREQVRAESAAVLSARTTRGV